jgi:perosamine synthetase
MSPMQARLVLFQLRNVDQDSSARIKNAKIYFDELKNIPQIRMPTFINDFSSTYLQYPIQVPDRRELLRYLMKNFRDCTIQHLNNCADLDCFSEYKRNCEVARKTANETILLPTYPKYSKKEVGKTINIIKKFYGKYE